MNSPTFLFIAAAAGLFGLSFCYHLFAMLFKHSREDHELRGVVSLVMAVWACFTLGLQS